MATPAVPQSGREPSLYRPAQALRWASTLVLVAIVVFVATAAYSAYDVARTGAGPTSFSTSFAPNDTLAVMGQFTFTNGGFYPLNGLTLHFLVRNGSGDFVGQSTAGPESFPAGATKAFPIDLFLPISSSGPAASLLTQDQTIAVGIWANTTASYLFPVSIGVVSNRSWGAPFADLKESIGNPFLVGGTVEVPVTISFEDDASFADVGTVVVTILSSSSQACGGGNLAINVPAGEPDSQTTDIALASGCSPAGGTIETVYTTSQGVAVPLPPEAIP